MNEAMICPSKLGPCKLENVLLQGEYTKILHWNLETRTEHKTGKVIFGLNGICLQWDKQVIGWVIVAFSPTKYGVYSKRSPEDLMCFERTPKRNWMLEKKQILILSED